MEDEQIPVISAKSKERLVVPKTTHATLVRIQLDMPLGMVGSLEEMLNQTDVRSLQDLVENALWAFQWAVRETMDGRVICSLDEETGAYKQIEMEPLARAREAGRLARVPEVTEIDGEQ